MARRADEHAPTGLPPGALEDKELTLAFQRGDKGAYQAIYDRYHERVESVCRRMLTSRHDAEEATQETFLRTYQALARFNGRYQLGPWITRIATNVCLDLIRARGRRPEETELLEELELDNGHDDESNPEALFLRNTQNRKVRRVLSKLPPLHRAAIVLRDFEGLSYQEIAATLSMTESQVKALLHRARQRFKKTWTSGLTAFLPARWLQRVRDIDAPLRDQAAQAATSLAPAAPACSALQQCGQYIAERAAGALAAALVTSAAASAAVVAPAAAEVVVQATQSASESTSEQAVDATPEQVGDPVMLKQASGNGESEEPAVAATASPEPSTTAVSPSPSPTAASPSPSPSPSASPSTGGSSGTQPSPQPSPQQEPAKPFTPAIGFDRGQSLQGAQPTSHGASIGCQSRYIRQTLGTTIEDGDRRFPGTFRLDARGNKVSLDLTLRRSDGAVLYYSGSGGFYTQSSAERLTFYMEGTYDTRNQEAKDSWGLPMSGSFSAEVVLDCASASVVSESVLFSTQ